MKRILLICNQNNNFFALTRYLRDRGYDANLYLMKEEFDHFKPETDSFNKNYKEFVYDSFLSMLPTGFYLIPKKQIKNAIAGYDFIIGCGLAPAYLNKIGFKLDLFIPYGTDLDYQPFLRRKKIFTRKILKVMFVTYHQKLGIRNSKYLMLPKTNNIYQSYYNDIHHKGKLISATVPFIYDKQYEKNTLKNYIKSSRNKFILSMVELRRTSDFIVFHHVRHLMQKHNPLRYTGNDKLIRGFEEFIQNDEGINPSLVLFEYGADVEKSKRLVKKLNIEKYVKWFPLTHRKYIMAGIELCDVGVAELSDISWITYSTVCEFMCMSKPIITYREDELYEADYDYLYPIMNASNANDVASALKKIYKNKELSSNMGRESKEWFNKYLVGEGLQKIINAIES